jgi:hypothetical protein
MRQIAENIWLLQFPLKPLGLSIGRNVTVIRLASGKLVVHSTAKFAEADVAAIRSLGEPAWLVDGTLFHDTFAKEGRGAFPDADYLAPDAFSELTGVDTRSVDAVPEEWRPEIEVLRLDGMPKVQEHVFFHRPSRTLIVCDLLFDLGGKSPPWMRFVARYLMRLRQGIGVSAFFQMLIKDRTAFADSIRQVLRWDFDRVIVGHGDVIEAGGKQRLIEGLRHAKFADIDVTPAATSTMH